MSTLVALVPRQLPRGHFVPVRAANEDCYSCLTGARVVQVQTLAQPRPNLGLDDWVQIRTQWDVTLALNGNGRMCEYARLLVISVTCRDGLYTSNDRSIRSSGWQKIVSAPRHCCRIFGPYASHLPAAFFLW